MQRGKELIGQNVVWILIAVLIVGFFVIANQSSETDDKDPAFVDASSDTSMYRGEETAPVDIVVYTDFLCPYCAQFANETMPAIQREFIDTGRANIEVRPVAMIGVDSSLTAQAAYCAADQEAFWPYHDATYAYTQKEIFEKDVNTRETGVLTTATLTSLMRTTKGVDAKAFASCLSDSTYAESVASATSSATANGVSGTPYVMINGNHVQGLTFEILSSVIKAQP